MTKEVVILNAVIFFYILQRISEMLISKENERWLKENCQAFEVDPKESLRMKVFHTLWFVFIIVEANIKKEFQSGIVSAGIYSVLGLCLGVRFYSMEKLKRFWTIKIFSLKNQLIVTNGLYKYIRHPNYLVVILEFIFLPLLFKAYFTMIVFSFLNIFVLLNRIKLEEGELMKQSNYNEHFKGVKRLFPFFLMLVFVINSSLRASELVFESKNYDEAKQSENYIKFEGESTKFGLVTTGFDGYAKNIKMTYAMTGDELLNLEVVIPAKSLDTDNNSRNEKMFNEILEINKYPEIRASLVGKVTLKEGTQSVDMNIVVKNKQIIKPVKFNVVKKDNRFVVTGTTSIGIKELALPDPSIAIAKVRDRFDLSFRVAL